MLQRPLCATLSTVLLGLLAACTGQVPPPSTTAADMPVYETFEAAGLVAGVVITATVTDETQTIIDDGGGDEANPGIELVATTVEVDEYLVGSGPDSLLVVQETEATGDNTVLTEGDSVVLALIEQDETSAPAVFEQFGVTYTPVSKDFGIAELRDGEVLPLTSEQPTTTLSDLRSQLGDDY